MHSHQALTKEHEQYIFCRVTTALDPALRTFVPIAGKAVVPLGVLPKVEEEGESADKVLVFAVGEAAERAKAAGADVVGGEEIIAEVTFGVA
jgi:hypothetical protein